MIKYEVGVWGLQFIFRVRGSVFPKAIVWAIPLTIATAIVHSQLEVVNIMGEQSDWLQVWAGYNFVLGFLLIFRTTEAYRRYWEGGTLMQQVRGEWYNATSSIISFCTWDPKMREEVEEFQHCLVRLVSLLYCAALQQVSYKTRGLFVLDYSALDEEAIEYLETKPEKCEVILQWVQRLIVEKMEEGVVPVPAPIITRVFQELSRGIVNMNNARKITDFLFPFPYAQMITIMLIINSLMTPFLCMSVLNEWWWSTLLTFITTTTFWSVHYIAIELEMPFGEDENDLPLADMQQGMNESLWTLLEPQTQIPPKFSFQAERHRSYRTSESKLLAHGPKVQRHPTRRTQRFFGRMSKLRRVWSSSTRMEKVSAASSVTDDDFHRRLPEENFRERRAAHRQMMKRSLDRRCTVNTEDLEVTSDIGEDMKDIVPRASRTPSSPRRSRRGTPCLTGGGTEASRQSSMEVDSEAPPRPKLFDEAGVHTLAPPPSLFEGWLPCGRAAPSRDAEVAVDREAAAGAGGAASGSGLGAAGSREAAGCGEAAGPVEAVAVHCGGAAAGPGEDAAGRGEEAAASCGEATAGCGEAAASRGAEAAAGCGEAAASRGAEAGPIGAAASPLGAAANPAEAAAGVGSRGGAPASPRKPGSRREAAAGCEEAVASSVEAAASPNWAAASHRGSAADRREAAAGSQDAAARLREAGGAARAREAQRQRGGSARDGHGSPLGFAESTGEALHRRSRLADARNLGDGRRGSRSPAALGCAVGGPARA